MKVLSGKLMAAVAALLVACAGLAFAAAPASAHHGCLWWGSAGTTWTAVRSDDCQAVQARISKYSGGIVFYYGPSQYGSSRIDQGCCVHAGNDGRHKEGGTWSGWFTV